MTSHWRTPTAALSIAACIAAAIAVALGAKKLIYLTDVPGVLESAPGGELVRQLTVADLARRIAALAAERGVADTLAELNRRLARTRVRAFAADPGLVNTAIAEKNEGSISKYVWKLRRRSGAPPEVPARTILFLSSDPSLQDATGIYWRDGRPIAPGPQALREDLARQLWDYSSQLCHISEEWEISR